MRRRKVSTRDGRLALGTGRPPGPGKAPCPLCGDAETAEFFTADGVPVFCNVTYETPAEAKRAGRGDIRLRICRRCGHVFNAAFVPETVSYVPGYENSQQFSERFRRYAADLAGALIERLDLRGKNVIEIGCGDGYFLDLLCRMGGNVGIGFDPAHRPEHRPAGDRGRLSFRASCYGPQHSGEPADLICCRHVLEHIEDPLRFLLELRRTVGRRDGVSLYFEVPNALAVLGGPSIWDVLYEHYSYFAAAPLERLLARAGFEAVSTWEGYEGQFLSILARPETKEQGPASVRPIGGGAIRKAAETFADRRRHKLDTWRRRLGLMRGRVVLWQAGSRGVMFLNGLDDATTLVRYVVDVNPRKQGWHIAGSAQKIVAPAFLQRYRPAAVVIMNGVYEAEIRGALTRLGISAEVLVA